ncbi:MAG: TetR family transcriptional regulator [Leifsonia sp.]|nr:TetR family transcriptional regulator [Leifsonia sp.]|tara:strand:+ start:7622 stop:8176 length:555 start_codon:yes stop_codon:yes gene_type:complete
MATSDELRRVALDQFSSAGYLATSLQNIADAAGVSKASVLYHFESKESLLDAALAPTVDALDVIVASLEGIDTSTAARRAFLAEFVDFLLEHRLGVHIFVNQSEALEDIAIIDRANALVERVAGHFERQGGSMEEKVRFGIALAGAAYLLAAAGRFNQASMLEADELRPVLTRILGELIARPAR